MNYSRRNVLRLSALPALSALAACGAGLKTDQSGDPNRAVVDTSLMTGSLSCDNASVPLSDAANRLSTLADFETSGQCSMIKDSFEGPFFFCTNPNSSEVAKGKKGVPLIVALRAVDAATCKPLNDAVIDIWHCDAMGHYSGYDLGWMSRSSADVTQNRRTPSAHAVAHCARTKTASLNFARFIPDYYIERATHIHLKAHIGNRSFSD